MPRLLSPDDGCTEAEVRGSLYCGRTVDVSNPAHVKDLRAIGYTIASSSGPPARARGFECPDCGFKSYFRSCSRCAA